MAKNQIPMPTGGSKIMPKLVGTALGLGMLVLIVKDPNAAATLVTGVASTIGTVVSGLAAFLHALS